MPGNAARVIENTVRSVAKDLISGDQSIAVRNLPIPGRTRPTGEVSIVTRMSAEIRFVSYRQKDASFVFRIFGSPSAGAKLADIWIHLTIRPAPDEIAIENTAPTLFYSDPGFLKNNSEDNRLILRLSGSQELIVDRMPDGRLQYGANDPRLVHADQEWSPDLHISLLRSLAQWVRHPSYGELIPLRLADGLLFRLLGSVGETYRSIVGDINRQHGAHTGLPRSVAILPGVAELVGGSYYLEQLQSTIRVNLNDRGEIAEDIEDIHQQIDLTASLLALGPNAGIKIEIRIPDFLVDGDLHSELMFAFRDHVGDIHDLPIEESDFRGLVAAAMAAGKAVVARIQKGKEETDVVLVEGRVGGRSVSLLYKVVFEIKTGIPPRVEGVDEAELIAFWDGARWINGRVGKKILQAYFERIFGMLLAWQHYKAID